MVRLCGKQGTSHHCRELACKAGSVVRHLCCSPHDGEHVEGEGGLANASNAEENVARKHFYKLVIMPKGLLTADLD